MRGGGTATLVSATPSAGVSAQFFDILEPKGRTLLKRFSAQRKNDWRALQIWQILIAAAYNRQILTYGILAKRLGYKGAGVFGSQLGHVAFYCKQNGLPPLTSLVVNEKTGLPGEGIPADDTAARREAVFRFNWFDIVPPQPSELREAYLIGMKG